MKTSHSVSQRDGIRKRRCYDNTTINHDRYITGGRGGIGGGGSSGGGGGGSNTLCVFSGGIKRREG